MGSAPPGSARYETRSAGGSAFLVSPVLPLVVPCSVTGYGGAPPPPIGDLVTPPNLGGTIHPCHHCFRASEFKLPSLVITM